MVILPVGRRLQRVVAMFAIALPLLAPNALHAAKFAAAPHATDPAEILQATQQSVASALDHGVDVGGMRLRLNLSTSNVGVSWQLTL